MTTPINPEPPARRRTALLVAAVVAAILAVAGAGAAIGVAIAGGGNTAPPQTTAAAAAPSPTRDANGEAACKDLEKQQAKKFDITLYASELSNIAVVGMQATDEDVREQSQALWDLLKRWGKDSNINGLDVERQVLNLVRACDDANYAF